MNFDRKKLAALAVAGIMSFGIAGASVASYAEAAGDSHHYEDGTTNRDSHEMKQEEMRHEKNVKEIEANYRYTKDAKTRDKELKKEQERHDKEMARIKARYDRHHPEKSR